MEPAEMPTGFRFPSYPQHVGSGSGKSSRILLFDRGDHPSVPTCAAPSRRAQSGGQGWPDFGPPPPAARSVLDGREHDGSIVRRRGPHLKIGPNHTATRSLPQASQTLYSEREAVAELRAP